MPIDMSSSSSLPIRLSPRVLAQTSTRLKPAAATLTRALSLQHTSGRIHHPRLTQTSLLSTTSRSKMPDWPTMPAPAGILSNRYRLDDIPDQHGRVAIVFGGSRGIGEATSGALAAKGAEVHIVGASPDHLKEAVAHIAEADPSAQSRVHTHSVDLGNLKETIGLAQKLADTLPRLDMLYLIAGIGVAPFGLTADGIGNHFAVNNLCQVAIVDVLLPLLQNTAAEKRSAGTEEEWSTRIVSESSELHRACPSDAQFATLEEMTEQSRDMDPTKLYGRSKVGQILLMRHMAPMLPHGIISLAVHPGAVGTEQQKGATEAYPTPVGKALEAAGKLLFMSKEQGAESALWAGTSPAVARRKDEVQGRYFTEADGKVDTESDQAKDKTIEQNFWNLCVKTLKDKAGYDVKLGK